MKGIVEAYPNGVAGTSGVSLCGAADTKEAAAGMLKTRLWARSFLMRHMVFVSAVMAGCLLALYAHRTPAVTGVPYEVQQLFWKLLA